MKTQKLTVNQLLNGIPQSYLEQLSDETHSDITSKRLSSREVFHLLLYGFIDTLPLSWRILEEHYKGRLFQQRFSPSSSSIDHSSLNKRLEKIPIAFFEQLFHYCFSLFEKYYKPQDYKNYNIIRFDSTAVTLSAKLLHKGMSGFGYPNNQGKPRRQVKFSIGFNGMCAVNAKAFFDQVYFSEDIALSEVILETSFKKNDVLVFDRGLSGGTQLRKIMDKDIDFVGRLKTRTTFIRSESLPFSKSQDKEDETVEIIEDVLIHRMADFRRPSDTPFRLVICRIKETNEEMYLLSNMLNLKALEIAQIYRLRWDIELFFKFLKQHMHFNHLLSRKEHSIKIVMYMSLIAATMMYLYKKLNNIEGFKIAKLRFRDEMHEGIIAILAQVYQNQGSSILYFEDP